MTTSVPAPESTTPPVELVALDMAGTTADEHGLVYEALQRCVEETGTGVSAADLQHWMGADKTEAIAGLLAAGGHAADGDTVAACFTRFREILHESYAATPPRALAGVEEALVTLRTAGIRVALTTGFDTEVATAVLKVLGWEVTGESEGRGASGAGVVIDALVCSDQVAAGRPAPYMIHRAMERTGVRDVARVLVAGDTVVDAQAGRAAGAAYVIGVLTGKLDREGFAGTGATHVLDGVAGIPALRSL
ncbi:phosphonatase-like hydrolase [Brevibacterium litoralis]|uniref:phosphonatase-like hydrolase n=1 Tax=Brevibacterium litoralis TaxID=3138935 RepID=UPI0032EAE424